MVGIGCFQKIEEKCISKKLGLYIKNPINKLEKKYAYELTIESFKKNKKSSKDFFNKLKTSLSDDYYNYLFKDEILNLSYRDLLKEISENLIVFSYKLNNNTIIVDDEYYFNFYGNDKEISDELRNHPLINPIDEYEIDYKFLYMYNFAFSRKNRLPIDCIFSTESPNFDLNNILDALLYSLRRKDKFLKKLFNNRSFKNIKTECKDKISKLVEFGKKYDKVVTTGTDYLKLDLITETLINSEKSQYAFINYLGLIEMLIINQKADSIRKELIDKLNYFLDNDFIQNHKNDNIDKLPGLLYDIRSRLIHGNFNEFIRLLSEYKKLYMKEFEFDYGEFKEENWIINEINMLLRNALSNMMNIYFNSPILLEKFKNNMITETEKANVIL